MSTAKKGDTVKVEYTGRLADGRVFDSTQGQAPIDFVVGEGKVLQGFEHAVVGMSPGDTKTIELPPEEGFGPKREELIVTIDRQNVAKDIKLDVGQKVNLGGQGQQPIAAHITRVDDSSVTVDANHPLAGETVLFDIALVEINS